MQLRAGRLGLVGVLPVLLAACSGGSGGSNQSSLALSQYTSAGCTDDTQSFLKTYAGTFADSAMTTTMTIGADGSFSLTENRQVGGNNQGVPYPTECTYDNQGEIVGVLSVAGSMQCQQLADDPNSGATSILVYSVSHVSIPSPVSASCQTFAGDLNGQAGGGGLSYSVTLILDDANSFQFQDNGSGPTAGETMVRR